MYVTLKDFSSRRIGSRFRMILGGHGDEDDAGFLRHGRDSVSSRVSKINKIREIVHSTLPMEFA